MSTRFYPSLSTAISVDQLPESLNFLTDNVNALLEKIYFKDLIVDRSYDGSTFNCKLELISFTEILKLEIPGTGIILKINPDLENPNNDISIIPLSFNFSWRILQFVKAFRIDTFSFQLDAFQQMILQIAEMNDRELLSWAIETFIDSSDPINQFIIKTNLTYPDLNLTYPPDSNYDVAISAILASFQLHPEISLHDVLFQNYIIDPTDLNESLDRLSQLFFLF